MIEQSTGDLVRTTVHAAIVLNAQLDRLINAFDLIHDLEPIPCTDVYDELLTIIGDAAEGLTAGAPIPDTVVSNVLAALTYLSRDVRDLGIA